MDAQKTAVFLDTQQQEQACGLPGCGSGAPGAWLWVLHVASGEARPVLRPLVLTVTLGSPMSPTPPLTHLEHETAPKTHMGPFC